MPREALRAGDGAVVKALVRETGGELCETHGSWVVRWDQRALKVKKPVRYSFLDYSTLERRLEACIAEVEVNAQLAPGVYHGVRALLEKDGRLGLGRLGRDPDAVEYAVDMRRFDEATTMAALVCHDRLERAHVQAAARRIARFHLDQPTCRSHGAAAAFEHRLEADLVDLEGMLAREATVPLRGFGTWLLRRHRQLLEKRGRRGLHRDGHGDLRADHVLIENDVLIVDRIEFDPKLRCTDVADDLAFLLMDLEHRGARWAAADLAVAYRAAGGDPGEPRLQAAFAWHRALVRAKVALLAGDEREAHRLLSLAERLAWRARGPVVLAVCGPPASGKSTLAHALAERLELPLVASDPVRKGCSA